MSPGDKLVIRLQMPGYGDVCAVCGGEASGFHAVPTLNGDLMSNDWPGEWFGQPACERCYERHARGALPTFDDDYRHTLGGLLLGDGAGI